MISLGMLGFLFMASWDSVDGLPASLADDADLFAEAETSVAEAEPELPVSVALPEPRIAGGNVELSLGAAGGFLKAKHADRGTWFAGVQGRLHFLRYFAAEASITFHENRYSHGDVHVTQYPVQVSAMVYPIPDGEFRPYAVGGFGWYYTRITYTGGLSSIQNETDHTFGGHVGAGLEIRLAPRTSIEADLRYIWLNPSTNGVSSGNFDYWQVTFGANFFF